MQSRHTKTNAFTLSAIPYQSLYVIDQCNGAYCSASQE